MAGVSAEKLQKALWALKENVTGGGQLKEVNSLNLWLVDLPFISSGSEAAAVARELRKRGWVRTERVRGGRGLYAHYITTEGLEVAEQSDDFETEVLASEDAREVVKGDVPNPEELFDELEGVAPIIGHMVRTAEEQAEQIRQLMDQLARARAENERLHDFIDEIIQAADKVDKLIKEALQG